MKVDVPDGDVEIVLAVLRRQTLVLASEAEAVRRLIERLRLRENRRAAGAVRQSREQVKTR